MSTKRYYSYPIRLLLLPAFRALLGVPSSISHDGRLLLSQVRPRPRILGAENIPPASPFITVINHPDFPGLGAWWGVSLVAHAIAERRTQEPREVRFVMAREWWYPEGWQKRIKQPLTHWFFSQISKAYGMLLLPPVVAEYKGTGAIPVRKILALTRGDHPQLVGISPEGRTGENATLCKPPVSTGLFLEMLSHNQIPFLPIGFFTENENTLVANFGKPFTINLPRHLPRATRDAEIACQTMVEIGKLLPQKMWGAYCDQVRRAL